MAGHSSGGLTLKNLTDELDDGTRNLTRIETQASNPGTLTTTSTTFASLSRRDFGQTTRHKIIIGAVWKSDLSNSAANSTEMALGFDNNTTAKSYILFHTGTVPRTSLVFLNLLDQEFTTVALTNRADVDNIMRLALLGRVAAGTGTFDVNTCEIIKIRGASET